MPDKEIGSVELSATVKIIFGTGTWQGRRKGSFRKFVATSRFTGPTPSGLSLDGNVLSQLLVAIKKLSATVPAGAEEIFAKVGKTSGSEIRVTILPSDEGSHFPNVDIREYVDTSTYAGPTKKGVRFPWDKLRQFMQLLEVLVHELGIVVEGDTKSPLEKQPAVIRAAIPGHVSQVEEPPPLAEGMDTPTYKSFPDAFLPEGKFDVELLALPSELLKIVQDYDNHYFITNGSDFRRQIRNEVEGRYFIYAQQRGCNALRLPKEMFKIFSAVAGYEKYCRELRQKLVRDFEARCRNRVLAEHMAHESLNSGRLPIC